MSIPEPEWWFLDALKGWQCLSLFRPSGGFGLSPIPFTDCLQYASSLGLKDRNTVRFAFQVGIIDLEFRAYHEEKNKNTKPKNK